MRRIFIAACIASGFTLAPLSGTSISQEEWTELLRTSRCSEDLIVLTNGSKLCGKITELPPLSFSFGALPFKADEIAAIGIISRDQGVKVQYLTYDGQNFIGSLNGKRFVLALRDTQNQQHFIQREIDGSEISFILLAKTTTKPVVKNRALFHISFQNGDHISARLESAKIHLTDGRNESTIDPQNIVEVCFNGGLQGQVIKGGVPQEIGFQFIKEPTISVQVPRKDLLVRLPWQNIHTIQAAHHADEWPEETFTPPTPITRIDSAKPAEIGNTFGKLLFEASGAITVPPQMFTTLDDLGNDPLKPPEQLDEPPALFSADEEESWSLDIAFSDEPEPLFDESEESSWLMNIAFVEEPDPLFDSSEESSWEMNIAFDNDNPQLFDHAEENTWDMAIVFEDDLTPQTISSEDLAMLDDRELNDLYKRYDLKAQAETEEQIEIPEVDSEEDLQETLAEVESEEEFIDALSDEISDDDEGIEGFYIKEDYIVLPGNVRDHTAYQATYLPTAPEPLLYARIPSYSIDETPITNRQYAQFVTETGHNPPKNWEGTELPTGHENDPVSYVGYEDAAAYAAWAGRRLPNEMEWSLAVESGLIVEDPSFKEWTSTTCHNGNKVVIQESGTLETIPTYIDRNLTFRTIKPSK